jgi:zinc transport system substrate-binding protein
MGQRMKCNDHRPLTGVNQRWFSFAAASPRGAAKRRGGVDILTLDALMRRCGGVLLLGVLLLALGCSQCPSKCPGDGRLPVFVGIPPLAYLVEQIGGDHVKVDVLVQPGQDPHTFQPTPQQAVALGRARLFFRIGMPFEDAVLDKIEAGNRRLAVIDATCGIRRLPLGGPCGNESAHDHESKSHLVELDPHVWLSPSLAKTMAATIAAELSQADPDHQRDYEKNLAALTARLDALDARIGARLAPYRGRAFYVFHPGFAYFADAYELKEVPIQIAGQTPSLKQLRELVEQAKKDRVNTVFIQPEFDPKSVQAIADAIHGQVVPINGLGKDIVADMKDIAEKVARSMQATKDKE